MNEQLIKYALISLALILGGRFLSNIIFVWIEDFFGPKKKEKDLDELIRTQLYKMGRVPVKEQKTIAKNEADEPEETFESLPPVEQKKREILARVYEMNFKKRPQETDVAYHSRLLGLDGVVSDVILKKAYKQRSKEFHPDMFDLSDFDPRLKERLSDRIHENYLHIQKAYEYLKRKDKAA